MPKFRYILAALLIAASLFATPHAINHSYEFRGQTAFGSEYLIIPFGIFLAYMVLTCARDMDKKKAAQAKARLMREVNRHCIAEQTGCEVIKRKMERKVEVKYRNSLQKIGLEE